MLSKEKIYYSVAGIPQYYNSIADIVSTRIDDEISEIKINTSFQPNSIPHIGSFTTLSCVFLIAQQIKEETNLPVSVEIDTIDCCPGDKQIINNVKYIKNISDSLIDGIPQREIYIKYFIEILDYLCKKTNIQFKIRTYDSFINDSDIKNAFFTIVKNYNSFSKILNPKSKKLHIRTKCPKCNLIDKDMLGTEVKSVSTGVNIRSICPIHGTYDLNIDSTSTSFYELNTQLRDLTKCYKASKELENGILTVLVDGNDWSGTWALLICDALQRLKVNSPLRLFCPTILDETGGKLSKSLYLSHNEDLGVEKQFVNYKEFKDKYSNEGIDKLFNEIKQWVSEPKKFLRNYSVEYIKQSLE